MLLIWVKISFSSEPVSISFSIQDVKPKTALDYLLNTAGLDYIEDSSTIIVGSRDTLNKDFYSRLSLTKFVLKYIESDIISAQIDALGIPVKKFVLNIINMLFLYKVCLKISAR